MKRFKVDFSKQGLQRFWLHHAEKAVLVVAVTLLVVFLWIGYRTPLFTEKTPDAMSALAVDAKRHISSGESWEKIKGFRWADSTAHVRIKESEGFEANSDIYPYGKLLGPINQKLGLRIDPTLRPVGELIARSKTIPIYVKGEDVRWKQFPVCQAVVDTPLKDKEGRDLPPKMPKVDSDAPGMFVTDLQLSEIQGLRKMFTATDSAVYPLVSDVVCVTGLIPYENQYAEFQNVFANSLGYYPDRDRPRYIYLDIERKIEGGEYENITDYVLKDSAQLADIPVPEVIDAKYYYDENITRPILPMGGVDYRGFASHPNVPLRPLVPTSIKKAFDFSPEVVAVRRDPFGDRNPPTVTEPTDGADAKQEDHVSSSDSTSQKTALEREREELERMSGAKTDDYEKFKKRIKPAAPFKLVRFFDLRAPAGKRVQYRVRIWMLDPNVLDSEALSRASKMDGSKKGEGTSAAAGGLDGGGGSPSSPGDLSNRNEGGLESDIDIAAYTMIAVQQHMLEPKVRTRLDEQKEKEYLDSLPADKPNIQFMLPTPWSEPTSEVLVGDDFFDVYAGSVQEPRMLRINNLEVPRDEARAKVVVSYLSKEINAAVPGLRDVGRGDVLNFMVPKAHVLNQTTLTVHEYKEAEIKTGAIVVDLMGGKSLDLKSKIDFTTPGAVLVMDANGNFKIHDEANDLRGFRHSMFRDDESNEYGKARVEKKPNESKGGGNEPPGG